MNDCYNISNLPNYENDCWLNTIIMTVLYSQYSRDLLLNKSKNWKSDIYLNIIRNIINSYYSNSKNANIYYQTIIPARLLFEIIINKKQKQKFEWNEYDILDFYNFLGVNCQDLIYLNDGKKDRYLMNYISKKNVTTTQPPEVLVLFHKDLYSISKKLFKSREKANKYLLDTSKTNVGTIATYENEIEFMGTTYILSSCITNNNKDSGYKYHSVAGIICNDKKMVFNSYTNTKNNPCSLMSYDWDLKKNEEFCLNPYECKLDLKTNVRNLKDLCFNFGTGNRILIYVQKNKIDTSQLSLEKIALSEFTPEPVLTNFQENIKRVREMSIIALYNELEKIMETPINIRNICSKTDNNRDEIEKIILESGLKTQTPIQEISTEKSTSSITPIQTEVEQTERTIQQGGMKRYTKKEILKLINVNLNKLNKNKLIYIYSQTLNH